MREAWEAGLAADERRGLPAVEWPHYELWWVQTHVPGATPDALREWSLVDVHEAFYAHLLRRVLEEG